MDATVSVSSGEQLAAASLFTDKRRPFGTVRAGSFTVEVREGQGALYALLRASGGWGMSLRLAAVPPGARIEKAGARGAKDGRLVLEIASKAGTHRVEIAALAQDFVSIRATVRFVPAEPFRLEPGPRDLVVLGAGSEEAEGTVLATQNGPNSGIAFLQLLAPEPASILYFQNFTALNPYFLATGTDPCDAVGGTWPEVGFSLPVDEGKALAAGEEVVLSDAILAIRQGDARHERDTARHFLQLHAHVYAMLDRPEAEYRDWIDRTDRTLDDLQQHPGATLRHYGHLYVRPYMDGEYPDSMVQMTVLSAIHDWGRWTGSPHPLERALRAGIRKFFDPKLEVLRRYLPNVGKDKQADAVDSWYLYHPLLNLGRLALHGDPVARRWFFKSLDYGIRAARHFAYKWPVQYDVTDFSVITDVAEADGRGQTDVGGAYAWVMLQAFELTGESRYLDEARKAIEAAIGLGFELNYQANLTAWGAAACMRMWRITGREVYREQSYVYLADFLHNCQVWESRLGHARHYKNFLAVTCLQDAPYMAMYECFESFAAFEHYLEDSGPDLDPAVRTLVTEYCKYAIDRAWFFYPDALPPEAISPEQREANGYVDRRASFPLEDLYPMGQPAGQVGQEVYGAGAAMVFATRAFHHVGDAPFLLFCNQFVRALEPTGPGSATLLLDGGERCDARLAVVRRKGRSMPKVRLALQAGDVFEPLARYDDRIEFCLPASCELVLQWE